MKLTVSNEGGCATVVSCDDSGNEVARVNVEDCQQVEVTGVIAAQDLTVGEVTEVPDPAPAAAEDECPPEGEGEAGDQAEPDAEDEATAPEPGEPEDEAA